MRGSRSDVRNIRLRRRPRHVLSPCILVPETLETLETPHTPEMLCTPEASDTQDTPPQRPRRRALGQVLGGVVS